MRERLRRIHARLPRPGTATLDPPSALSPPLSLDFRERRFNADVLMEEQLLDPDQQIGSRFDLMLSPELLHCLAWTGPKNPLDRSVWDDSTDLGRDCARAFGIAWLVVVRTRAYELPERVSLEVFVVEMATATVRAAFSVELAGRYRKADLGRGRFASEAERQLASDAFVVARCEVARRLGALPGARVDLGRDWPSVAPNPCASVPKTFALAAPPARPPVVVAETKPEPGALRSVDWANRVYLPSIIELREGSAELREYGEDGLHDTDVFRLSAVDYGDLDGDGSEEAVVTIEGKHSPAHGGFHATTRVFVFSESPSGPRLVADMEVSPIPGVSIESGRIVGEHEGCRRRWRLDGERLSEETDPASCAR